MKKINRGTKRILTNKAILRKFATFAVILFAAVSIAYAHENPCKRHSIQTVSVGNHKTSVSLFSVLINPYAVFPTSSTNANADKDFHKTAFHYNENSENTAAFVTANWAMPASFDMSSSDEETASDFEMQYLAGSILPQSASISDSDESTNTDFINEQPPVLKNVSAQNIEAADLEMMNLFSVSN